MMKMLLQYYCIITTAIHSFIHSQALIVQDGPLASLFGVSWSHTYRHTVGLLWTSDQPVTEASTYTGQHNIYTQQTKIHTPSGIRTRDPSNQAAAGLLLRPSGHWDRLTTAIAIIIAVVLKLQLVHCLHLLTITTTIILGKTLISPATFLSAETQR
jgi:hypothetical protein